MFKLIIIPLFSATVFLGIFYQILKDPAAANAAISATAGTIGGVEQGLRG